MRATIWAVAVATAAAVAACERPSAGVELRADAARICRDGQSLLLAKGPSEAEYRLGRATFDSAQLLRTIPAILGPRPNKVVLVDVEPEHKRAPQWLVAAIQQAGGDAFQLDSACLRPAFRIGDLGHPTIR